MAVQGEWNQECMEAETSSTSVRAVALRTMRLHHRQASRARSGAHGGDLVEGVQRGDRAAMKNSIPASVVAYVTTSASTWVRPIWMIAYTTHI